MVGVNWFQGPYLLGDDHNFRRRGEDRKEDNQMSRGESCFLFYQSKYLSQFVPLSLDTALKMRSLG